MPPHLFDNAVEHQDYRGLSALQLRDTEKNPDAKRYQNMIKSRRYMKDMQKKLRDFFQGFSPMMLTCNLSSKNVPNMNWRWTERDICGRAWKISLRPWKPRSQIPWKNTRSELPRKEKVATKRQTRSTGQLAKIATIIVPCTFATSIVSMGGSFAAGQHLLYIYWVISIPSPLRCSEGHA